MRRASTPAARWIGSARGVDHPVAERRLLDQLLAATEPDRGARREVRPTADLERLEHENALLCRATLLADDGLQVLVGDLDLPVGQILEARERPVEVLRVHREPDLLERVDERMPAAVLAQDQRLPSRPISIGSMIS